MMPTPPEPPAIHVTVDIRPIDFLRLALCIEHKEAGKWSVDGGKPCWTRTAWFEVCPLAFSYSSAFAVSRCVMQTRLMWLAGRFSAGGVRPTPYLLAVAWNRGYDAAYHHAHAPGRPRIAYGVEVFNLYEAADFKPDPLIP